MNNESGAQPTVQNFENDGLDELSEHDLEGISGGMTQQEMLALQTNIAAQNKQLEITTNVLSKQAATNKNIINNIR